MIKYMSNNNCTIVSKSRHDLVLILLNLCDPWYVSQVMTNGINTDTIVVIFLIWFDVMQ